MWNELELDVKTLEAETINKVQENITYLRALALAKGIEVRESENASASYDTEIVDVVKVLNRVEKWLDILDEDVTESLYYNGAKIYATLFLIEDYNRWVLILRDIYDILINDKGTWGVLQLSDGTPTIDGKKIILRGDKIGAE